MGNVATSAANFAANLKKKACAALILCVVCAVLTGLASAMVPQRAYADSPTYTMSVVGADAPSSIAPGDEFTLSLKLENNESSQYTMYAMSATVRYNTSMLEVVSLNTNNNIDVYTRDAGDGFTDAVLNFKARTLKGVTWNNDTALMDVTFKALEEGSTAMSIQRANVSNSTGMGRYACTCVDANITVSSSGSGAPAIEPSTDESAGTTAGIDAPEADPSTLEGVDTSDTMTEEEKAEYEATKSGELAASVSSGDPSSETAGAANGKDASASGQQNHTVLYLMIAILVIAVIALIAGVIVHKRRSNAKTAGDVEDTAANAQCAPSEEAPKAFSSDSPTEVMEPRHGSRQ